MSNNSKQFIAFEVNDADKVEISGNTAAGEMNNFFKSHGKIGTLRGENNTILNTSEKEVLSELIDKINSESGIPDEIKSEIDKIIQDLNNARNETDKRSLFNKIAQVTERLVAFGSGAATIYPAIVSLIAQLPK
ncbi:hypothetical protein [Acinetobacter baumannii]|uniref:hypothetical protein n=1 Tax=Acinetobacter baumannii TaxID=470 RepID=UPI001EF0EB6E|nr:hypothetical protein [Acinetobacter baumannii]MCG6644493.1 hypothetical protein [Acinetobacter baumannii]MCG6644536.1 hypothetical protein [Acinetobacter baumannii]